MALDEVLRALAQRLIVSCQPVPGGAFDTVGGVLSFARAALDGGAAGLRIEGAAAVAAVSESVDCPVIGLIKRDLPDSLVRITPLADDIRALARAGADVIAIDATDRERPVPVADLIGLARSLSVAVLADVSTPAEGRQAIADGANLTATTLSGYTEPDASRDSPDFDLVADLVAFGAPTIAEGLYQQPDQAARAIALGAHAVVVGSAITRPELITTWFADAVAGAVAAGRANPKQTDRRRGDTT